MTWLQIAGAVASLVLAIDWSVASWRVRDLQAKVRELEEESKRRDQAIVDLVSRRLGP